ncbi:MAG: hypothetical protein SVZ03_07040 [Spirochaetota bacterium]|nr:hypothetical protein [Spirochaetota bacterium]
MSEVRIKIVKGNRRTMKKIFLAHSTKIVHGGTILSCLIILVVCLCIAIPVFSEDGYQIMLKNYNMDEGKDQKADLTMELIKKNGKKRVREVTY